MRLVFITQVLDSDDHALGFVHTWVRELAKNVDSLTVIALRVGTYDMPHNVRVVSLGKEHNRGRMHYLSVLTRELVFGVGEYDRVLVHMNPEYLVLFGWWWKLVGKKSLLWYTHKNVDMKLKVATLFADVVATASVESFRYPSEKVRIVGHGIDLEHIPFSVKAQSGVFALLTIGRVTKSKQIEVLIKAVQKIRDKGIHTTLRVVGSGITPADTTYLDTLNVLVRELSLGEYVTFVGPIPHAEVARELREADCFVNASSTGGLDKAVLEAMGAGRPVVTSNDGLKTVLALHPELMFKDGDVSGCADVLASVVAMPDSRREALCQELASIVEAEHSLSALMPKLTKLLE
jgi:glycosyltransferase involved in cell wall biosynthesis